MILDAVSPLIAMGAPAGQSGQNSAPMLMQFFPLILMLVVFYFILIRPQQKKAKEHEALLKTLKNGDKVQTTSGIVGVVVSVKEHTVSVRSDDSKLEILKSAVAVVSKRDGEISES